MKSNFELFEDLKQNLIRNSNLEKFHDIRFGNYHEYVQFYSISVKDILFTGDVFITLQTLVMAYGFDSQSYRVKLARLYEDIRLNKEKMEVKRKCQ